MILGADVPEVDYDVPQSLARMALGATPVDILRSFGAYRARQSLVERDFADLRRRFDVTVLEPASVLCGAGYCRVEDGGRPLYRDHHHLSVFGAGRLVPLLVNIL